MKERSYTEWWRRILNLVIDFFIVFLLTILTIAIFDFSNNVGGFKEFFRFLRILDFSEVILAVIYFLYYLILESIFGITFGKLITKTKIIDYKGLKPSFWKICLRTLIRFIPIDCFTFLRKYPFGWHDSLSKTKVVRI